MFRTGAFRCGPSQAGSQAIDQRTCCFGPESSSAGGSAALGLCMGQVASAPGAHPPEVSGVGGQLGFQVWAPSPLIWVSATGLPMSAGATYPVFTVQELRGEGRQRLGLLWRVL